MLQSQLQAEKERHQQTQTRLENQQASMIKIEAMKSQQQETVSELKNSICMLKEREKVLIQQQKEQVHKIQVRNFVLDDILMCCLDFVN